ncbi:Pls/PosA family non-ribosomal peptide synthetase [Ruania halotolerans]|uniref:Pls/PosA family non-ribosomal peptide synthetase n=1 Tax=Ruania halotolerans TaxID=2897773 RepID=UPI001E3AC13D|nr:Pls/PosA family non-ribosomal peptide synthetase [Ruania halotolerans]UFU05887.1 amino acid adenylation domain-containing protein [Ruania halotolerans]
MSTPAPGMGQTVPVLAPGPLPTLLASDRAAPARTLLDVFTDSLSAHPEELALDSGVAQLTYREFAEAAGELADRLTALGTRRGDRIGLRVSSGTTELYVAVLGILMAGAAYVPVDADDPPERARTVFTEAAVVAVVGNGLEITAAAAAGGAQAFANRDRAAATAPERAPRPGDDAWIIFTSGSTGTPKGVAVTHRSAAAFVDAESHLFLTSDPIGPGDRVMAGLSVGFDASCEEMWLAWAHAACLVPAPRSLVRSGVDVGPWLTANDITIVSTVPTLVALWPASSLDRVRLLILGGEAAPAELAARLQRPGREVWNTYGPTEATVVACAAPMDGTQPVRIGLPLAGWDLAVVDGGGAPVAEGETGELIIGGVGLARYLDPDQDAEKYAPMPSLGWARAYRSGDMVRNDAAGLVFAGRADDQIKLGGRRIELGEIDGQLLRLPGVVSAAAAVRGTAAGNQVLVGYLTVDQSFEHGAAVELLRDRMPAALVPRLAVVEEMPTRTSGKVDRDALPWPLPSSFTTSGTTEPTQRSATQEWLAGIWHDVLAADPVDLRADFFELGGGSLTAAQTVGRIRERYPEVAVADIYANPTIGALSAYLEGLRTTTARTNTAVSPIRTKTKAGQLLAFYPLRGLTSMRWLSWLLLVSLLVHPAIDWLPAPPVWLVALTTAAFVIPQGRMLVAAGLIRLVLRGVRPGTYPRGGKVHLRYWLAGRIQDDLAAASLAGAASITWYARLLGARIGPNVDLHALPPVTGFLDIGARASVEQEVDLTGAWIDGDRVHLGRITISSRARIGARSTLGPGATVGQRAEVAPGSFVAGRVRAERFVSGSPAEDTGQARGPWSKREPSGRRAWVAGYAVTGVLLSALPWLAATIGGLVLWPALRDSASLRQAWATAWPLLPLAAFAGYAALIGLVLVTVRLLSLAIRTGPVPVRSGGGLAVWATVRLLDEARDWLFPLYAGALTPWWLRALGATVGRGVEASTVVLIPKLTQIGSQSFLADDTLVGGYELTGGWLRAERVKVGKRAFLGNSGMAAPGRKIPKASLVAVLSAAPKRGAARAGSSWIGSPPTQLRRVAGSADESRTYQPTIRLRVLRGLVETCRVIPLFLSVCLMVGVGLSLLILLGTGPVDQGWSWGRFITAGLVGPVILLAAALLAAGITVAAKWLLVGAHKVGEHPLWSGAVWRGELADAFTEVLAARWFCSLAQGTVALNMWFRALGAKIGDGVWCDTYWLPEPDLVELGAGSCVNAGCVVQTHLFHDRVLAMDRVIIGPGATLGPNSVILPAAHLDREATVGPASLVMRGESVPSRTRWLGNPIGPWEE